jgi:hypothetical protein
LASANHRSAAEVVRVALLFCLQSQHRPDTDLEIARRDT